MHSFDAAGAELDRLEFVTHEVSNAVADRARMLRAAHDNRHFPLVDALVVAFGLERSWPIVTCDAKWPPVAEADIEVLLA